MRTRLLTAAILLLLLNSIAADGENNTQPTQNDPANETPSSEAPSPETPPTEASTPESKAPETSPSENATPDTTNPETAPTDSPGTPSTENPAPESPATQTPPTENPPPPIQDDDSRDPPEDTTITPKAPEDTKPRPTPEPLSTENYNRDSISYSHKGPDNAWSQSPEEERTMIDFINSWADHAAAMNSPIVNFEVPGGGVLEFYVNVAKSPVVIRGLYSVSEAAANSISFAFTDPLNQVILLRSNIRDLLFYPTVNLTGKYKIEFKNKNVAFALPL